MERVWPPKYRCGGFCGLDLLLQAKTTQADTSPTHQPAKHKRKGGGSIGYEMRGGAILFVDTLQEGPDLSGYTTKGLKQDAVLLWIHHKRGGQTLVDTPPSQNCKARGYTASARGQSEAQVFSGYTTSFDYAERLLNSTAIISPQAAEKRFHIGAELASPSTMAADHTDSIVTPAAHDDPGNMDRVIFAVLAARCSIVCVK